MACSPAQPRLFSRLHLLLLTAVLAATLLSTSARRRVRPLCARCASNAVCISATCHAGYCVHAPRQAVQCASALSYQRPSCALCDRRNQCTTRSCISRRCALTHNHRARCSPRHRRALCARCTRHAHCRSALCFHGRCVRKPRRALVRHCLRRPVCARCRRAAHCRNRRKCIAGVCARNRTQARFCRRARLCSPCRRRGHCRASPCIDGVCAHSRIQARRCRRVAAAAGVRLCAKCGSALSKSAAGRKNRDDKTRRQCPRGAHCFAGRCARTWPERSACGKPICARCTVHADCAGRRSCRKGRCARSLRERQRCDQLPRCARCEPVDGSASSSQTPARQGGRAPRRCGSGRRCITGRCAVGRYERWACGRRKRCARCRVARHCLTARCVSGFCAWGRPDAERCSRLQQRQFRRRDCSRCTSSLQCRSRRCVRRRCAPRAGVRVCFLHKKCQPCFVDQQCKGGSCWNGWCAADRAEFARLCAHRGRHTFA